MVNAISCTCGPRGRSCRGSTIRRGSKPPGTGERGAYHSPSFNRRAGCCAAHRVPKRSEVSVSWRSGVTTWRTWPPNGLAFTDPSYELFPDQAFLKPVARIEQDTMGDAGVRGDLDPEDVFHPTAVRVGHDRTLGRAQHVETHMGRLRQKRPPPTPRTEGRH